MMFYIKRSVDSKAEGPFTAKEIKQMIKGNQVGSDALGLIDLGCDLQYATSTPVSHWARLADIPEISDRPQHEKKYVLLMVAIVAFLILVPLVLLIKLALWLNQIR